MAFTDHCDVFGAVHEDGINRVIMHLMQQRPSLFNYGTAWFAADPDRMCQRIIAHPEVTRRNNPLVSVEDPIAIPGTDGLLGMDFCFQLAALRVDFHPGNVLALPPELNPPLQPQTLALGIRVCGGLACPDAAVVDRYAELIATRHPPLGLPGSKEHGKDKPREPDDGPKPPPRPLPGRPICFCLDVFATAGLRVTGSPGRQVLSIRLGGLEIVDITPAGLEHNLECFLATTLRVGILPRLRIALDTLTFELGKFASLTVEATPVSATVPHNPAIQNDQLEVFISTGVGP